VNCSYLQQIWAGPLTGYRQALLLVNRGPGRVSITAYWDDIGIPPNSVAEARDLWEVLSIQIL
jgi:alpha-galactosidase